MTSNLIEIRKKIMHCFWELGYGGASIKRLEEYTGLDRKQLSRQFGNKKSMFLHSLEDFYQVARSMFLKDISQASSIEDIKQVFIKLANSNAKGKGCLIIFSTTDASIRDDQEIFYECHKYIKKIKRHFLLAMKDINRRSALNFSSNEINQMENYLFNTYVGILTQHRLGISKKSLIDTVHQSFNLIE